MNKTDINIKKHLISFHILPNESGYYYGDSTRVARSKNTKDGLGA